jgi:hypothetical protein
MGRGRAKAKQTKVARDLKYRTIETDFTELQRELHGHESAPDGSDVAHETDGPEADEHEYDESASR